MGQIVSKVRRSSRVRAVARRTVVRAALAGAAALADVRRWQHGALTAGAATATTLRWRHTSRRGLAKCARSRW